MATITPKLSVILNGSELTEQRIENTFSVVTKIEKISVINSTSADLELDLSNLSDVNFILISATGAITVTLTPLLGEPLAAGYPTVLNFNTGYPCILPVNDTTIALLDSIAITTASTTDVEVTYQAYGL
jgi:hypothetical protein